MTAELFFSLYTKICCTGSVGLQDELFVPRLVCAVRSAPCLSGRTGGLVSAPLSLRGRAEQPGLPERAWPRRDTRGPRCQGTPAWRGMLGSDL